MPIPTESIGSIPRSRELLTAMGDHIARLEQTGSPVLTDGEQTKPSFATYPLAGLPKPPSMA